MTSQPKPDNGLARFIPQRPKTDVWDLTPFLSAPAVIARRDLEGSLQVVNIPDSQIPSPLASNLTPSTLLKIRQYLVGTSTEPGPGNGAEVWASWQRAWDIWNNHYIEGRVNPVWIAEQFPVLKKRFDDRDAEDERKRRDELWRNRRNDPSFPRGPTTRHGPHGAPGKPVSLFDAGGGKAGVKTGNNGAGKATIGKTTSAGSGSRVGSEGRSSSNRGWAHGNSGTVVEKQPFSPWSNTNLGLMENATLATSGPIFTKPHPAQSSSTGDSTIILDSKGNVITGSGGRPKMAFPSNPTAAMPGPITSQSDIQYPELPLWKLPEEGDTNVDFSEEYQSEDDSERQQDQDDSSSGGKLDGRRYQRGPGKKTTGPIRTPGRTASAPNKRSPKRVEFMEETSNLAGKFPEMRFYDPESNLGSSTRSQSRQKLTAGTVPKRGLPRKHTVSFAHVGDSTSSVAGLSNDDTAMKDSTVPGTHKEQPRGFGTDSRRTDSIDVGAYSLHESDDDDEHLQPGWRKKPDLSDGSSGGWVPMKNLPHYRFPQDPCLPDDDPEQIAWEHLVWDDPVENTVWRPRTVGEKRLKIEIDVEDAEDDPELTATGGIDCGKEPYPVLRPLNEYILDTSEPQEDTLRKKKVWDGVTGTIFNLPMKPLEPDPEPNDEKLQLIKSIYSEPFRDARLEPPAPIFPLDIRRIEKVLDSPKATKVTPLLGPHERTIISRTLSSTDDQELSENNPWRITDKQKALRDIPARRWPPGIEIDGPLLPTDDTIWREELTKDQFLNSRYFVTNLHGGTLLINGQQVRKGCIAGPLPAFAVIETPGGQVSFWWGIDGREYKAGVDNGQDLESKWELLRKQKGWENIAKSSGAVWENKILERARAERTGNRNNDDEIWEKWKKTEEAEEEDEDYTGREFPLGAAEPRFTGLDDENSELRWLAAFLWRKDNDPSSNRATFIEPTVEEFWEGPAPRVDSTVKPLTRLEIDKIWYDQPGLQAQVETQQKTEIERLQKNILKDNMEKRKLNARAAATNKRKAEGTLNPTSKKRRADEEGRILEIIDAVTKRQEGREAAINQIISDEFNRVKKLARDADLARTVGGAKEEDRPDLTDDYERNEVASKEEEAARLKTMNRKRKLDGRSELPSREEWEAMRFKKQRLSYKSSQRAAADRAAQINAQRRRDVQKGSVPQDEATKAAHKTPRIEVQRQSDARQNWQSSTRTLNASSETEQIGAQSQEDEMLTALDKWTKGEDLTRKATRNPLTGAELIAQSACRLRATARDSEEVRGVFPHGTFDSSQSHKASIMGFRQPHVVAAEVRLDALRKKLPHEQVAERSARLRWYWDAIDDAANDCVAFLFIRQRQGGAKVSRILRKNGLASVDELIEQHKLMMLRKFYNDSEKTELEEVDLPFPSLTDLPNDYVGKRELIKADKEKNNKFWKMWMALHGFEEVEKWSRDPRGQTVIKYSDMTKSVEF